MSARMKEAKAQHCDGETMMKPCPCHDWDAGLGGSWLAAFGICARDIYVKWQKGFRVIAHHPACPEFNPHRYGNKEDPVTEETKPARRIVWQKDDIRLIAEGNKAVAMERCFMDELGNDMWRDSPNWHAELLAQALVDCEILNNKLMGLDQYAPVLERVADIEKKTALDADALELGFATHNRRLEALETKVRRLDATSEALETKVRRLDATSEACAGTINRRLYETINTLSRLNSAVADLAAKLKKKHKKLRLKVAGLEDDIDALITSQPGARSNG